MVRDAAVSCIGGEGGLNFDSVVMLKFARLLQLVEMLGKYRQIVTLILPQPFA